MNSICSVGLCTFYYRQFIEVCPPPQVAHAITVVGSWSDKPSIFLLKALTWAASVVTLLTSRIPAYLVTDFL